MRPSESDITYNLEPGIWYITAMHRDKGHLLSRDDNDVFWCGRWAWPNGDALDIMRIDHWWVAVDQRKTSRCSECKTKEQDWRETEVYRRALAAMNEQDQGPNIIVMHPDALPLWADILMGDR